MNFQLLDSLIYCTTSGGEIIAQIINELKPSKIILLTDITTQQQCLPLIEKFLPKETLYITIQDGESAKTLETCTYVWQQLSNNHADRQSLLINLGGGVIADLGGFAAAAFKRGIRFMNIPTTLLAQVDAAIGGKTGIDFGHLKNEIGFFQLAHATIIDSRFLKSLPADQRIAGFAEMLKHALIFDEPHWNDLVKFPIAEPDYDSLLQYIEHSVRIKKHFVENDPTERGIRKALNFGHTIGHALESLALERKQKLLHGEAVAIGMVAELYMSAKLIGFDKQKLTTITQYLRTIFPPFRFAESDFEMLTALMLHDKKNIQGNINFTLLPDIGQVRINQSCDKAIIIEALQYYLENFK